jgi:hypothetical protein
MNRAKLSTVLAMNLILIVSTLAGAQITGSIRGTVRDPQGGVLPGVTVTAASRALLRSNVFDTTDQQGRYRIAGLPAGTYQLQAVMQGFANKTLQGIQLGLNQDIEVEITMEVAGVQESVTVTAETPLVEVKNSSLNQEIRPEVIDNMPLNGRQFLDLVGLVPGTAPRPSISSQGSGVTVFGERSISNSFLIDGMENNDDFTRNFGEFFIQDAIEEFKVELGGYKAEFGRASGAVANVITRSGSNELRGRAFYFLRDDSLDSSNIENQDPPALRRDEVGGTLGAFQYLREDRGNNFDLSRVPDIIKSGYFTPTTGGEDFDAVPQQRGTTTFFKVNHQFSSTNQIFVTTNINLGTEKNVIPPPEAAIGTPPPGSIALPSTASDVENNTYSITGRHTKFFGQGSILESSFRYLRLRFRENADKVLGAEQLFPGTFLPGSRTSLFWLSNATSVGITDRTQDRFQWSENFSYFVDTDSAGSHDFKFGGDFNRVDLTQFFRRPDTMIIANTLYMTDYQRLGLDVTMQRAFNPADTTETRVHNNILGLFGQDTWEVRPGLTINAGLRYDFHSLFSEDKNNLAPRIGLAWDPKHDGKTVIRASFGYYYDSNILEAATSIPELGGIQFAAWSIQIIPRGASFFDNPAINAFGPLQAGGTRWLGNPKLFSYLLPLGATRSSGPISITGLGQPYIIYDLLGIPVSDPRNPPVLAFDTIGPLTGGRLTPDQALQILNDFFPGASFPQFVFLDQPQEGSVLSRRYLAFKFRERGPVISRINTLEHPTRTPYTRSFNFGVERQLFTDLSVDAQVFVRQSRDLLARRVVNLLPRTQLRSTSCAGNTVDGGPCRNELQYIGFLDSNVFTLALKKRLSHRYSFLASYTYTDAEDNFATLRVPPLGGQTSFLFSNEPELDIGRSLNTPNHVFVLSGLLQMPYGIDLSGILKYTSGFPFNAAGLPQDSDGDEIFDNRLIGTEKGEFLTDAFFTADLRLAKEFGIGSQQRFTVLVELFNLTNRANPFRVNTAFGPSIGQTIEPLPGREIQFGFRFDF